MTWKRSLVAGEAEVIRLIESDLGRTLPWLDEFDEQSFGIVVVDQHVRCLAAPESGLERLPDDLGRLAKLEILNLRGGRLQRLPDSLGDLGNLRTLGLRANRLSSLPDSIGRLLELRALSVSGNSLHRLPDSIGSLVNLRELVLHQNDLSSLPDTIGRLINLQLLVVTENRLESIPEGVGSLRELRECYLGANRLTRLPGSIVRLTALRRLGLEDNPLDDASRGLARTLVSSGCVVSMGTESAIQARMAELAADPEAFARNPSGEDLITAMKAIFIRLIPCFEGVEATYEEDYCVSAVRLSQVQVTESGIEAVVTFLSGYEEPGRRWDFSCRWSGFVYTASRWFVLNIGTFTFQNSHLKGYDEIRRGIDETNRLLGLDRTIARVEKPEDEHYWGQVGTEYLKAGRFEEAERALRKSLEFNPASAPAWGRLVIFFANRGRKAEALDAAEHALQHAPAGWPGIEVMQKYRKDLAG